MSQHISQRLTHDQRLASSGTSVVRDGSCALTLRRPDLPHGWPVAKFSSRYVREKRRPIPPPPQNNVMFHESRYKTVSQVDAVSRHVCEPLCSPLQELCRQFEELGDCEYGDRCLFAHGMDELKNIPHRHPKFKTEK